MTTELTAAERFEILDLVNRYALAIDTRDWELFESAFVPEASVDYGFRRWHSAGDFTAFMRETHAPAGRTLHVMTSTAILSDSPLVSRTYGEALVLEGDDINGTVANGWYDDELVRTEGGLQIARRTFHMVSMRSVGPNLAAGM